MIFSVLFSFSSDSQTILQALRQIKGKWFRYISEFNMLIFIDKKGEKIAGSF